MPCLVSHDLVRVGLHLRGQDQSGSASADLGGDGDDREVLEFGGEVQVGVPGNRPSCILNTRRMGLSCSRTYSIWPALSRNHDSWPSVRSWTSSASASTRSDG